MSVSKDKLRGTWKVYIRYKDFTSTTRTHTKRGFKTKREGVDYEREFMLRKSNDLNMTFKSFVKIYYSDLQGRIKENTFRTKQYIIEKKLIPFFGEMLVSNITNKDIFNWQNELLEARDIEGKAYSKTYLRTIQNQLNAIFNHAYKYYDLKSNPIKKVEKIGKAKAQEMLFWTTDEYRAFINEITDKPKTYYAVQLLYWTGIRLGELLALTFSDFDFKNKTLSITKSYQRIDGQDIITEPKTEKSVRTIYLPQFLLDEIKDYSQMLYGLESDQRLFDFTKSYLYREIKRGSEKAGVKKIRVHDLRHSHVAYLINRGFSPILIAERLGHETINVTYNYAHLYPSQQEKMVLKIEDEWSNHE